MYGDLRAELGDRHRRVGEHLEQERLELVVGAVDLVDQQHRRAWARMSECGQDRAFDQVVLGEHVGIGEMLVASLGEPDGE